MWSVWKCDSLLLCMEPFIKEEMITDTKIVIAPHGGHMGVLMRFHRLIFKTIFNRGSLSPVGKWHTLCYRRPQTSDGISECFCSFLVSVAAVWLPFVKCCRTVLFGVCSLLIGSRVRLPRCSSSTRWVFSGTKGQSDYRDNRKRAMALYKYI